MPPAVRRLMSFAKDPVTVAKALLGLRLVRVLEGERLAGRIVEAEAYLGAADRAAHTFGGRRTPRNESMYLAGGHAYVYFTYGMHFCLNVVCGQRDEGVAVLIRALEPVEGIETMFQRRPYATATWQLCSGPGKLTQALTIDRDLDREDLRTSDRLFIEVRRDDPRPEAVVVTPRVGVAGAGEWAAKPLRFFVAGSRDVSPGQARPPKI